MRRSQSRVLSYSALPSEGDRIRPQPAQTAWPEAGRFGSEITRVKRICPTERSLAKSSYGRRKFLPSLTNEASEAHVVWLP